MTSVELIDSIINDLNEYIRANANGQYVQGCAHVASIAQKLILLRQNVEAKNGE